VIRALAGALALALLAAAPSPVPSGTEAPAARAHWPVATSDSTVQELVDRGTTMLYAFDVGEARVAFAAASRREPNLVLPYIGAALADTIDINLPSTAQGELRGARAVAAARSRLTHATDAERVLVAALAQRYAAGTRREKFARFARAVEPYAKSHRDDPNLLTIAAFALFESQDTYTAANDALTPQAQEILDDLDRALALDAHHLGAHHLRIHLLEESDRAQQAAPDADALASYLYQPGESHLLHMPSHIWSRLGEYAKLIDANERALANDRAWFALGDGPGQQYMKGYHDHDVDFVLYGLTTVGRDDEARAIAAREDVYSRVHAEIRLHDDARALAELWPGAHFERAFLSARTGDPAIARNEIARIVGGDADAQVQRDLVEATSARRTGHLPEALRAYARAYEATKNGYPGDPKDFWWTPVGEGYGATLLAAQRPAEAETVFAAELRRFPADPHLEWALAEAQKAQGKPDDAARAAYRAHWKGAKDLTLADLG
jgi:predicted Zn-dependent protease